MTRDKLNNKADEIWKSAIKLRGKFKAYEYQNVILPIILLRRIECVLEEKRAEKKEELLVAYPEYKIEENDTIEVKTEKSAQLQTIAKEIEIEEYTFHNTTNWTIKRIIDGSAALVSKNFREYINGFSDNIAEIFDKFDYAATIGAMEKNDSLLSILKQYATEALGPKDLSNLEMGYIYEELLRKFSEQSGEEAGEHFTPREVIRLMVELLEIKLNPNDHEKAISIYDPACGTGGMLTVAKEYMLEKAKDHQEAELIQTIVQLFGQELQGKNYAICKADMLIKSDSDAADRITHGNSLVPDEIANFKERGDLHANATFDYMLSNPPFGVNWGDYATRVKKLSSTRYKNNFPTVKDGALLFLMSMIEKMKLPADGGSKIAAIFNGSPLSNGDALSGESEIRKYMLEADLLDCIVMLPDQLFYNTGIYTYVWILNNNKPKERQQKVLLVNARSQYSDEPKSLGQKRHRLEEKHRIWIEEQYKAWTQNADCKVFDYHDFAFQKVGVVFWQTDENDQPTSITEKFASKLNNKNVGDKVKFFGGEVDFELIVADKTMKFKLTEKQKFETVFAEQLSKAFADDKTLPIKTADVWKWWQRTHEANTEATYTHRHYITDTEYIPYGENIEAFLKHEIDKPIIWIDPAPSIGYEVLPNKYFFNYTPPSPAQEVIEEFWALEKEAINLLNQIK